MVPIAAFVLGALLASPAGAGRPVLRGSSTASMGPLAQDLLVFKGTLLLNEFVYRAVLRMPPDARATPQVARWVVGEIAGFLREAGYDLAKVRAQVKDEHIEVEVDEGALERVIVVGSGWLSALRLRAALHLPLDVFNRRLFEAQMATLSPRYGMNSYDYELWPLHVVDNSAVQLDGVEELRAMPLLRKARGYELRIFAKTDPWGSGFAPEVVINGSVGVGIGGRYRFRDLIQEGDRWELKFRGGGASRGHLAPDTGSRLVNSNDLLSGRWLSKPWGGSSRGLRWTLEPRAELWSLQRRDLMVEGYRLGVLEVGTGPGAQLTPEFSVFLTGGVQRRWLFDFEPARGTVLQDTVTQVPAVSNRAFLRLSSRYTFNVDELRQDLRNQIELQISAFRPTADGDRGFFRFDLQGRRLFAFGWHELRLGARVTGEAGDVSYADEIALADHLRIGFGLEKYTQRAASFSVELRVALLRDKLKIGLYNDLGVWRHLPRDDANQTAELAGSSGAGLFLFVFDELQIDAYFGAGWSPGSPAQTGFALAIKEAF